ncbi:MAG: DoxX family protein [Candidatus Acidiferrales bacterium]
MLTLAFVALGALKVFLYNRFKTSLDKKRPSGITRGFAAFIGTTEVAGGLGIVLPIATNVAPSLTAWAAVGLATVMTLAIGFNLRRHEFSGAPVILLLLTPFVAFGRFPGWATRFP